MNKTSIFIEKSTKRLCIELPPACINVRIQFLNDHAIISKPIELWPTEKALMGYIASKWKPLSHFDLQLGSKIFFVVIVSTIDDKDKLMDGG